LKTEYEKHYQELKEIKCSTRTLKGNATKRARDRIDSTPSRSENDNTILYPYRQKPEEVTSMASTPTLKTSPSINLLLQGTEVSKVSSLASFELPDCQNY